MAETIYPERLRCKNCRKKLDKIVLDGLFCSYTCAKVPTPSPNLNDAPRHCKREVGGVWGWKTKFRYDNEVPEKLRKDPATNIYSCDYCHFKHVGHSRLQVETTDKLRRTVADAKTLGSVIQRSREQRKIEKKLLAKALNVPVIRITEIENGDPKMNIQVLFAVMNKLRIAVELIER